MLSRNGLDKLRWHFKLHAWAYRLAVVTLAIVGSIFLLASKLGKDRAQRVEEVRNWQLVDALILKSKLTEINTSDETTFSTQLSLQAKFRYILSGTTMESDYIGIWTRQDQRDWNRFFEEGQTVTVRVSPSEPTQISLIDTTGVP
ncbi:hypothetical protein [Haloferula sp.]|uniref:hypothetical protein n=1 Tax=Haloferula sp. TaxID=2497595 RepID=UPI00329DBC23